MQEKRLLGHGAGVWFWSLRNRKEISVREAGSRSEGATGRSWAYEVVSGSRLDLREVLADLDRYQAPAQGLGVAQEDREALVGPFVSRHFRDLTRSCRFRQLIPSAASTLSATS
jgi:hypothetical protein